VIAASCAAITIFIGLANYFTLFNYSNFISSSSSSVSQTFYNVTSSEERLPQWMISPAALVKFAERFVGIDKFTTHAYEGIYWLAFTDLYQQNKSFLETARIWEIGLGCDMPTSIGGSAFLWRSMFPKGKIHMFEYNQDCVDAWVAQNPTTAVVHIGDQSNPENLLRAIKNTNETEFDIMVDDGSHYPPHTKLSLITLWPFVKPGGIYVLEDIHVNCFWDFPRNCFDRKDNATTFFSEMAKEWLPIIAANRNSNPLQLPDLQRIEFHHEAVVFTKKQKN